MVYQVGITARLGKAARGSRRGTANRDGAEWDDSLQGVQLLVLGSGYRIRKRFDHDPASRIGNSVQSCWRTARASRASVFKRHETRPRSNLKACDVVLQDSGQLIGAGSVFPQSELVGRKRGKWLRQVVTLWCREQDAIGQSVYILTGRALTALLRIFGCRVWFSCLKSFRRKHSSVKRKDWTNSNCSL